MTTKNVSLSSIIPIIKELGFYHAATSPIDVPSPIIERYDEFVAKNYHGTMGWLAKNREARRDPRNIFSQATSILILTHPYPFVDEATGEDASAVVRHNPPQNNIGGVVARYARGVDYHVVIKEKLKTLQTWLASHHIESRVIADSAPFFEKPMAARAGIGWQGKHTNLLNRELGNWFFLAEVLLSANIIDDRDDPPSSTMAPPSKNMALPSKTIGSCGSCQACLDSCPTQAFPAPYQLDARKCISYLTIEHRGLIDKKFRRAMGNMLFGCDICLAVCPFNKFAESARDLKQDKILQGAAQLSIHDILTMTTEEFANRFSHSPIKRLGLVRLQRNALVVLANYFYERFDKNNDAAIQEFLPVVLSLLAHDDMAVRGSAIWCLRAISPNIFITEKEKFLPQEKNQAVIAEWQEG